MIICYLHSRFFTNKMLTSQQVLMFGEISDSGSSDSDDETRSKLTLSKNPLSTRMSSMEHSDELHEE